MWRGVRISFVGFGSKFQKQLRRKVLSVGRQGGRSGSGGSEPKAKDLRAGSCCHRRHLVGGNVSLLQLDCFLGGNQIKPTESEIGSVVR